MCGTHAAEYRIKSSTNSELEYTVHTFAGEQAMYTVHTVTGEQATCSCPGYKYSPIQSCKHIRKVYKEACMYTEQNYDDHAIKIKPYSYSLTASISTACPRCGSPCVPVTVAI